MPYLYCGKRKRLMKVNIEICYANLCPHIDKEFLTCNFKSPEPKRVEKRKKK